MKSEMVTHNEIKLVGITAQTSNALELTPETAKIGLTISRYFNDNLAQKIKNRKKLNQTYCVYTGYESDEHGPYTYFIVEQVNCFKNIASPFEKLIIPPQNYIKFSIGPGPMPTICIHAWKEIWKMSETHLGGKRTYIADFEIYDEKAKDYSNAIFDIFVGVKD